MGEGKPLKGKNYLIKPEIPFYPAPFSATLQVPGLIPARQRGPMSARLPGSRAWHRNRVH